MKKEKKGHQGKLWWHLLGFRKQRLEEGQPERQAALTEAQSWGVTECMTVHRDTQEKGRIRLEKYQRHLTS